MTNIKLGNLRFFQLEHDSHDIWDVGRFIDPSNKASKIVRLGFVKFSHKKRSYLFHQTSLDDRDRPPPILLSELEQIVQFINALDKNCVGPYTIPILDSPQTVR